MGKEGGGAGDKQSSSDKKGSSTHHQQTSGGAATPSEVARSTDPREEQKQQSQPSTTTTSQIFDSHRISQHQQQQHQYQQHSSTQTGHQVIAVSASKGPAAFFNLARKFLATDEFCDLSALEGAIVSAVDAAHLLERSKLADIVRIQTSYVPVEPKRRSQQDSSKVSATSAVAMSTASTSEFQREDQATTTSRRTHLGKKGAPLRRSRIIITVKRTLDYKQWLEENPYHASGHTEDLDDSPT